jgi:Protein of unknown function (DUF2862)
MQVGQQVLVRRLKERVPGTVIAKLGKVGVIMDLKVLDGQEIGALVEFEDKFATWFFEDELELT